MQFNPHAVVIEGRSRIAIGVAGQTDFLEPGVYAVWAAADTFIKVAPTASDVAIGSGYLVKGGGAPIFVRIGKDGQRIGSTAAASAFRVA